MISKEYNLAKAEVLLESQPHGSGITYSEAITWLVRAVAFLLARYILDNQSK